jgi:hypothetical protein
VTSGAKKVLEEALALSEQEREELVNALSSSLEPVERGEAELLDAEEHLAELRQKQTR